MTSDEHGSEARRAASILIEVLDLPDDAATIGHELTLIDRDQVLTVFAAEFESTVGPAAFLVYVYRLNQTGDDGRRGHDRFRDDLETLETAARLNTPGPRTVSHARAEDEGLILATTPAVWRALRGEPDTPAPAADPALAERARGKQALALLGHLGAAEHAAERWLAVTGALSGRDLTPEELELSLFLNDERSIKNLLQALNQLLATSRPPRRLRAGQQRGKIAGAADFE
ncbi:MAG: hypothetical protein M3464_04850 [Chloroflexota bacterium]|nr:hypothetical protein [Chloroflexota bacterium]